MYEIKLFGKAFIGNDFDYKELSTLALKVGYIVHPDCSTRDVYNFLKKQKIDYKSTFYQTWKDVTDKDKLLLLLDQMEHYGSTYGTNFKGEVYLPERTEGSIDFTKFKVILPISEEKAYDRCFEMLSAGVALSQETIEDIVGVYKKIKTYPVLEDVKNKEARMIFCKEFKITPNKPEELVRFLVYLATGKTLLIKDRQTIQAIKESEIDIVEYLNIESLGKLAEVFFRFKPLLLAFKRRNGRINNIINHVRRLAVTNHKPYEKGFFEDILTNYKKIGDLPEKLKELNNFKKVALIEAINYRMTYSEINSYLIRNGKMWINKEGPDYKSDVSFLKMVRQIIYGSLIEELRKKATKVKLPTGVGIPLPKSEKAFIGNYPIGTAFHLSNKNAVIGINWTEEGEGGVRDLDFSLNDMDGNKIGWNSGYYNDDNSLIFSGDMTSAKPEATELFFASEGFTPSLVKINNFSGEEKAKFKFFIAAEEYTGKTGGRQMIDPNNIIFSVNDIVMESKEMAVGVITGSEFILSKIRTGEKAVSGRSITDLYTQYMLDKRNCYVDLRTALIDSGFEFVESGAEIDFTDLSKDTLISLLSKEDVS